VDAVLQTMVQRFPTALLSHPHLQQTLMEPVLDASGGLELDEARQPRMHHAATGVTMPAAEGVVPVALLKRAGLRDLGARLALCWGRSIETLIESQDSLCVLHAPPCATRPVVVGSNASLPASLSPPALSTSSKPSPPTPHPLTPRPLTPNP